MASSEDEISVSGLVSLYHKEPLQAKDTAASSSKPSVTKNNFSLEEFELATDMDGEFKFQQKKQTN